MYWTRGNGAGFVQWGAASSRGTFEYLVKRGLRRPSQQKNVFRLIVVIPSDLKANHKVELSSDVLDANSVSRVEAGCHRPVMLRDARIKCVEQQFPSC